MARRDRKSRPHVSDWHLWSEVARSVDPLRPGSRRPPAKEAPAPEAAAGAPKMKIEARTAVGRFEGGAWSPQPSPAGAHRTGKASSASAIEPRIRRRLMRGQLPIDATIDLHGMRRIEARKALLRFIAARHARGDRTVLVITGKGLKKTGYGAVEQKGVLRAMLPNWLSEPALAPLVAGWEVSARTHGGEGAFYVRLKRPLE